MKDIDLTPHEKQILQYTSDPSLTRRRRTTVVLSGIVAAILLSVMGWLQQSWQAILVLSILYIAITIGEKVAYANAVLVYKSLIQKLKARIEDLES